MRPTGHLVTTAVLSAGIYAATRSPVLTAGVFIGGFLIDLDHLFDYLIFNGQRDLRPRKFVEYYMTLQFDRVVIFLHSYELMAVLIVIAIVTPHPLLVGYLIGATLHLSLDLIFNQWALGPTLPFYSFIYRARRGFARSRIIRTPER